MRKYIIGAGLNGLITAYYLKDYYLIDKKENIGGQFKNKYPIGPRYIHYNKEFEKLLQELKIKYTIKTAIVKYCYKGRIVNKLTEQMKKEYAIKTRNSKDDNSYMNDKNKNFRYFEFNIDVFVNKIFKKIQKQFINNSVKKIDIENSKIILNNNKILKYDKLISTIHYKIFCKIADILYKSKCKDIYIYWCKNSNIYFDVDFIYHIDVKDPINRISYTNNFITIETVRKVLLTNYDVINFMRLEDYKLSSRNRVRKYKNIIFIGRYANLDNSKRINSVIEEIKNVK